MKKNFLLAGILFLAAMWFTDCTYRKDLLDEATNCPDTVNVSYSLVIRPILQTNCFSCHGNGSSFGSVSLDSYAQVKTFALNGQLLGTVSHSPGYSPMPQGAEKLSDCKIASIRTWIQEGAKDN